MFIKIIIELDGTEKSYENTDSIKENENKLLCELLAVNKKESIKQKSINQKKNQQKSIPGYNNNNLEDYNENVNFDIYNQNVVINQAGNSKVSNDGSNIKNDNGSSIFDNYKGSFMKKNTNHNSFNINTNVSNFNPKNNSNNTNNFLSSIHNNSVNQSKNYIPKSSFSKGGDSISYVSEHSMGGENQRGSVRGINDFFN